jgi:uncharacterized protein (DUF58 family)
VSSPSAPAVLRLEAASLATDLPGLIVQARRLASAVPGVHGRRRAGQGEDFWQFRDYRAEDGARHVDWRRSARGERLFVREREMQAAQAVHLWVDPSPGFAWSSAPDRWPAKAARAMLLAVALGMVVSRGGERVGALGGPGFRGASAPERLAEALITAQGWGQAAIDLEPAAPPSRGVVALFSDYYAPPELWRERLRRSSDRGAYGVLIAVIDPAEEDFPFRGRVRFRETGGDAETVFGRAEEARVAYRARLADHRAALRAMAEPLGFPLLLHRTDRPPASALASLIGALAERDA